MPIICEVGEPALKGELSCMQLRLLLLLLLLPASVQRMVPVTSSGASLPVALHTKHRLQPLFSAISVFFFFCGKTVLHFSVLFVEYDENTLLGGA